MMTICGLDEAGRGPLAGPVTAGCVVLGAGFDTTGLTDSKKLSARQRNLLAERIRNSALAWGLGWSTPAEIDRDNILRASLLAMTRAWDDMLARFPQTRVDEALVDGLFVPRLSCSARAIVHGDALVMEISAASILAKVARDTEMDRLHRLFPRYGFDSHRGYPTKEHRRQLALGGPCPQHRVSFQWKKAED